MKEKMEEVLTKLEERVRKEVQELGYQMGMEVTREEAVFQFYTDARVRNCVAIPLEKLSVLEEDEGENFESLVTALLEQVDDYDEHKEWMYKTLVHPDMELVKKKLNLRVIPLSALKDQNCLFRSYGDIAVVVYLELYSDEDLLAQTRVTPQMEEQWHLSREEIFSLAEANTLKNSPPRLLSLWDFLEHPDFYVGLDFMGRDKGEKYSSSIGGICLTGVKRMNGAVTIFLPGVARALLDFMGEDYYLVFTSIHEIMVHPVSEARPAFLADALGFTIQKGTPPEDRLTRHIYRYHGDT